MSSLVAHDGDDKYNVTKTPNSITSSPYYTDLIASFEVNDELVSVLEVERPPLEYRDDTQTFKLYCITASD